MKTNFFAGRFLGVARKGGVAETAAWTRSFSFHRRGPFIVAGLALLLSGCATHKGAVLRSSGRSDVVKSRVSPFGAIALAEESDPATFGFQAAKGRLGSIQGAILDSAELGLSAPGAGVLVTECVLSEIDGGDPEGAAIMAGVAGGATVVGAALAGPVVGARGLIRSFMRVSPTELAERETSLANALGRMAEQQAFHQALLQAGTETIRGGFVSPHLENRPEKNTADATFEARVDDLRLERAGPGEGSYVLRIKTHARLVRALTFCA